jgi:hypothetical protein
MAGNTIPRIQVVYQLHKGFTVNICPRKLSEGDTTRSKPNSAGKGGGAERQRLVSRRGGRAIPESRTGLASPPFLSP